MKETKDLFLKSGKDKTLKTWVNSLIMGHEPNLK